MGFSNDLTIVIPVNKERFRTAGMTEQGLDIALLTTVLVRVVFSPWRGEILNAGPFRP